jgi:hypothetical protein
MFDGSEGPRTVKRRLCGLRARRAEGDGERGVSRVGRSAKSQLTEHDGQPERLMPVPLQRQSRNPVHAGDRADKGGVDSLEAEGDGFNDFVNCGRGLVAETTGRGVPPFCSTRLHSVLEKDAMPMPPARHKKEGRVTSPP